MIPEKAFILAAGLGTRMRPLTDKIPKPLLEVAGQSLLQRALGQLETTGVKDVVINTHHLADKITQHLKARTSPALAFSHEETLLDTGGGIKKMLQHFGGDPFYVLSGDGLWTDNPGDSALRRLADSWDSGKMDILILLQPVAAITVTKGVGDYDLDAAGRAARSRSKTGQYMFTSIRINHPRIFAGAPDGAFSYLDLLDQTESRGRLYGIVHDADWHHLSTPADLRAVDRLFLNKESAA